MEEESKKELTPSEAYLIRLLSLKSIRELTEFLSKPDDVEALSHMEPPDGFYEEITRAEEGSQMVEELERLYALS